MNSTDKHEILSNYLSNWLAKLETNNWYSKRNQTHVLEDNYELLTPENFAIEDLKEGEFDAS